MAESLISVYGGMFDSTEVVEEVGGFPRGNKAVDSEFFAKMISCFWSDGVLGEDSFKVSAGGGLQVKVSAGIAWIKGYMAWQKAEATLTLTPGVKHTVALRLNRAAGEFSLVLGDESYEMKRGDEVYDLVLANVVTQAGATSVADFDIRDTRGERELCGIVTSTVDALRAVENAENANNLGGSPAADYVKKSGGTMSGELRAAPESAGKCVVRNIGYGASLPESLADGELFVLVVEE